MAQPDGSSEATEPSPTRVGGWHGSGRARAMVSGESGLRFRWTAAVLLGVAGLVVNLGSVQISPGTDLVFGGVLALLAAVALGPVQGLVAASIASVRTIWLWEHPYAWLIFSLEALVAGVLVHRWNRRPVLADLIYWALVGVPILFLTYYLIMEVRGFTFAVIALKQPFNGLINAVLVEMLLLLPPVRRLLRIPGAPRLQSALAVVVTTSAVLPTLVFGVWVGRGEWTRNVERAEERVRLASEAYTSKLQQYVSLHEQAVRSAAESAERRGGFDPEQLQRLVSVQNEQFPGFVDMYAADSRGVTVAFHPLTGPSGDSLIGLDFSDRSYFSELRQTRATVISDVFAGRGGVNEPLIIIAHPIVLADTFAGYVLGALDLKQFPLPDFSSSGRERLQVADHRGILVFDSEQQYRPGELPRRVEDMRAFQEVRQVGEHGIAVYATRIDDAAPAAVVASQVIAGVDRIPQLGWWVWVEESFAQIQSFVSESYVRLFSLLIGVTLLGLLVSTALAWYLSGPLLRLRAAANALAAGDLGARVGRLPDAVPTEIQELGEGFDEMASVLTGRTEELQELGEIARSLASTLHLRELFERITDAAMRLVDPDGCGIALLTADGETLRAADYSLGLLAATAGREIPADTSIVGRVARTGKPLLIPNLSREPHAVKGDYLDPARDRSMICAPLVGRSGPLGALTAVRGHDNARPFTSTDLRLLERLAGNAAVAVENARLLEAAEAASRSKSDFIATMSHELRTPLNAVLGHLELLEMGIHGEINHAQRTTLGRIQAATRHLRGLIEEVLSFSRLEAGRVEVRLEETDLREVVAEVVAVVEPLAQQKGLEFSASCGDEVAQRVLTDPDKVRQILINLAGNAVKFTEQGEVRIEVEERSGEVAVSVRDTGVGIAPEDQERLFRPFEQLESGFARPHGGTGLGLYLSGRYAELVGGRIAVRSAPGRGSDFTLVLPVTPDLSRLPDSSVVGYPSSVDR